MIRPQPKIFAGNATFTKNKASKPLAEHPVKRIAFADLLDVDATSLKIASSDQCLTKTVGQPRPESPSRTDSVEITPPSLKDKSNEAHGSAFSSRNTNSKDKPITLTAENLAKVNLPLKKTSLKVHKQKGQEDKTGMLKNEMQKQSKKVMTPQEEPEISADKYMQKVWEAASSAPTSMVSSKTRELLNGFGSGLSWQDMSLRLVEKYAKLGKPSALKELLRVGCNPGTRTKPRYRPLINAVQGGSPKHNKCVSILLRNQADPNACVPGTKRTALHLAIENNNFHGYTNLIRDLLEAGADPNAIDSNGDSPLLQILYGGYEPLEKHKRDALACLLQSHLSTNVNVVPPGTQNMPLHLAIRRKDPFAVAFVVRRGAEVNRPNGAGVTPLMLAANSWGEKATKDQIEILKILLKGGVNVQERNRDSQMSALDVAVSSGCERAVDLLRHKMDAAGIDTAFDWAQNSARKVSSNAHSNIMKLLFETIDIEFSVPGDQCAIMTAVLNTSIEDVKILLDYGANVNHREKASPKAPLLHLALKTNDQTISKLLVDRGAFVDATDDNGTNGIECARTSAQDNMVVYLQRHGKFRDRSEKS